MNGEKELVDINDKGDVLVVNRGKKGAAIVNISQHANYVDAKTTLPDGKYADKVYGNVFKVKKGRLTGMASGDRTYIIGKY